MEGHRRRHASSACGVCVQLADDVAHRQLLRPQSRAILGTVGAAVVQAIDRPRTASCPAPGTRSRRGSALQQHRQGEGTDDSYAEDNLVLGHPLASLVAQPIPDSCFSHA